MFNVTFNTLRSVDAGGLTGAAQLYLQNVQGFIMTPRFDNMLSLPTSAMRIEYWLQAAIEADIVKFDVITSIIRIDTGQPWFSTPDTETWRVVAARNSTPGILEHKLLMLSRYVASGPMPS